MKSSIYWYYKNQPASVFFRGFYVMHLSWSSWGAGSKPFKCDGLPLWPGKNDRSWPFQRTNVWPIYDTSQIWGSFWENYPTQQWCGLRPVESSLWRGIFLPKSLPKALPNPWQSFDPLSTHVPPANPRRSVQTWRHRPVSSVWSDQTIDMKKNLTQRRRNCNPHLFDAHWQSITHIGRLNCTEANTSLRGHWTFKIAQDLRNTWKNLGSGFDRH